MGELHLEVIKNRLLRDFNLNVNVHKPRVSYRETVARASEVVGECNQTVGGQALFARVRLRLEPLEGDKPVTVGSAPDVALPPALLAAVLETLTQQAEGGGSLGFPLSSRPTMPALALTLVSMARVNAASSKAKTERQLCSSQAKNAASPSKPYLATSA